MIKVQKRDNRKAARCVRADDGPQVGAPSLPVVRSKYFPPDYGFGFGGLCFGRAD